MIKPILLFLFCLAGISANGHCLLAASPAEPARKDWERNIFEDLIPLHKVKTPPGPYDWLANHEEPGQTFSEYTAGRPVLPDAVRKIIYVTLLGEFDAKRRGAIEDAARFIAAFYGLPVKFTGPLDTNLIPANARRTHPQTGDRQLLTTFILDELLVPRVPPDAFCLIAFTTADLWPGEGWNFVFGQASLPDRVGVWSIYRNGDPNAGSAEYKLCLLRTIKNGVHEISHMFSLYHCIYYECLMNGSNHRAEADSRPLWLCPVCLRKLAWAIGFDVAERFGRLAEVAEGLGLSAEAEFYRQSRAAVIK